MTRKHTLTATEPLGLLQGSLDMLILKVLELEPMHGWGISQRIRQRSRDALQVTQGSLYPALHRLEKKGWIRAEWAMSQNNRRAKYYTLTEQGRRRLRHESEEWERLVEAVGLVMRRAGEVTS